MSAGRRLSLLGVLLIAVLAVRCGGSSDPADSNGGHSGKSPTRDAGLDGSAASAGGGGTGAMSGDAAGGVGGTGGNTGGTGGESGGTGGGGAPDGSAVDAADGGVADGTDGTVIDSGTGDVVVDRNVTDGGVRDASSDGSAIDGGVDAGPGNEDSGATAPCVVGSTTFLPIPDRVDVAYDAKRCRVYVTTTSGWLKSHDLRTGQTENFLKLGDLELLGMDISPGRDALLVADHRREPTRNWVHLVDLRNGTPRRLEFPLAHYEGGTYTATFLNDTTALVTSEYEGSGWVPLRRVNLTDGSHVELRSVRQDTMLTPSADRSVVAFAESNTSGGWFGTYRVLDQAFETGSTGWFTYEIGVSRDATQVAVPTYNGLYVFRRNSGFQQTTLLGTYAQKFPVGVVYSPVADVMYVAWYQVAQSSSESDTSSVEAIDTRSFGVLSTLDQTPGLIRAGNFALVTGRMKTSPDGKVVLATVRDGVRLYPVVP